MDIQKSDDAVNDCEQSRSIPVSLAGSWVIEDNSPFGFVIRDIKSKNEFHFASSAIGWATCAYDGKPSICMNGQGPINLTPIMVDKESIKKMLRIEELKRIGNDLTEIEKTELLTLCGLIGRK